MVLHKMLSNKEGTERQADMTPDKYLAIDATLTKAFSLEKK